MATITLSPDVYETVFQIKFWSRVRKTEGCWIWEGATNHPDRPYGRVRYRGRSRVVHAVSYELIIGSIPEDKILDHLCRNPKCVNPRHLEPVTIRENNIRAIPFRKQRTENPICPRGHTRIVIASGALVCRQCAADRQSGYREKARAGTRMKSCGNCGQRGHNRRRCKKICITD